MVLLERERERESIKKEKSKREALGGYIINTRSWQRRDVSTSYFPGVKNTISSVEVNQVFSIFTSFYF